MSERQSPTRQTSQTGSLVVLLAGMGCHSLIATLAMVLLFQMLTAWRMRTMMWSHSVRMMGRMAHEQVKFTAEPQQAQEDVG